MAGRKRKARTIARTVEIPVTVVIETCEIELPPIKPIIETREIELPPPKKLTERKRGGSGSAARTQSIRKRSTPS